MKSPKKSYLLTNRVYPPKSFDELNKLLPGRKTDELVSLISENVVRCGIRVFNVMRGIEQNIIQMPISKRDLKRAGKALEWHSKTEINRLEFLLRDDPGLVRRIEQYQPFHRERNRPRNYPLHILVMYLRRHILKVRPRPHNSLICDFLAEQKIHKYFPPKRISEVVKKVNIQKFEEVYTIFHEIYEAPGRVDTIDSLMDFIRDTRRITVNNPTSERDVYVFPPWDIFMP